MPDTPETDDYIDRSAEDEEALSPSNDIRPWLISVGGFVFLTALLILWSIPSSNSWIPLVSSNPSASSRKARSKSEPNEEMPESYRSLSPPGDASLDREQGKALYEQHCSTCHGKDGSGNGPVAEVLTPAPQTFSDSDFVRRHSDRYLFWRISEGKRETPMPAFKHVLSSKQRWHIVRYLHALSSHE